MAWKFNPFIGNLDLDTPGSIGEPVGGLTAGSVLFGGASGVLAQDNANFFWDDTNNYLGIGTNAPSAGLHIGSSAHASGTATDIVVEGRILAGNALSGTDFTSNRWLGVVHQPTTSNVAAAAVAYNAQSMATVSGTFTGLSITLSGTPTAVSGSGTFRGFFFTSTVSVPTGVTVTESLGGLFQNSSVSSGGTITKATGLRIINLGGNTDTTTPTQYGIELQVAGRASSATLIAAAAVTQGTGSFTGTLVTDFVGFDMNTAIANSATVTNWSAFRCSLTPTNPTGNKYVFNITSTLSSIHGGSFTIGGTTAPTSILTVAGPLATAVTSITNGAYTVLATDSVILCNATSGTVTPTLPTAVGCTGRQYTIKKTDSSLNTVVVTGNGVETIDGSNTATLTKQYESITLVSDNAAWHII